eukprot:7750747-Pyramimonas_sp.AAC.1
MRSYLISARLCASPWRSFADLPRAGAGGRWGEGRWRIGARIVGAPASAIAARTRACAKVATDGRASHRTSLPSHSVQIHMHPYILSQGTALHPFTRHSVLGRSPIDCV